MKEEQLLFPEEGSSRKNGIIFFSKRHKGYGSFSTIDSRGNIKTQWGKVERENINITQLIKCVIGVLPGSIMFTILMMKSLMLGSLIGCIRILIIDFVFILLMLFAISTVEDRKKSKRVFQFHAAEHMVVNACVELERVPTLPEIRQYSRFLISCGTNSTAKTLVSCLVLLLGSFNIITFILGIIIIIKVIPLLLLDGYLNFLQKYTTSTPTDEELLVAIEAMTEWLKHESFPKET